MSASTTLRGVDYLPTSLTIARPMTLGKWQELLAGLGAMATGHQWWIGDALVWGEEHFGEDQFSQGAEALRLEPHTLTNYRWVSSKIDTSRRREELTWSHHAEVARLDGPGQELMLREALEHGWGIRELREAVALRYPQANLSPASEPDQSGRLTPSEEAQINRRLEGLEVALEDAHKAGARWHEHVDLDDVDWLYRLTRRLVRGGKR